MEETTLCSVPWWPWGIGWELPIATVFTESHSGLMVNLPTSTTHIRTQQCCPSKERKISTFKLQEKVFPDQSPEAALPTSLIPKLPRGVMERDTSSPMATDPLADDTRHGQECVKGLLIHNWGLWVKARQASPTDMKWLERARKDAWTFCKIDVRVRVHTQEQDLTMTISCHLQKEKH